MNFLDVVVSPVLETLSAGRILVLVIVAILLIAAIIIVIRKLKKKKSAESIPSAALYSEAENDDK